MLVVFQPIFAMDYFYDYNFVAPLSRSWFSKVLIKGNGNTQQVLEVHEE